MSKSTKRRDDLRAPDGSPVGEEELRVLLAEEGYSADEREGWLKEVLTALTMAQGRAPTADREQLIAEIRDIVRAGTGRKPMSDDVL
ncbi:MAG: hypothetical protein AB7O39_14535 [Flavobacteriaceae bacterium]